MSVEVKICGLTNRDDARMALEAGADYLGFVLYAPSRRGIAAATLRSILDGLGAPCRAVAVFVDAARAVVEAVARDCGLHAVQLHGRERPEDFGGLPVPVWRALRAGAGGMEPLPEDWPAAERYVVDAAVAGQHGGTGVCADWDAAARLARHRPVMLAGGLTAQNVTAAVRAVRPLGVDVAGGVERAPGLKDEAKVRAFIREAKHAA